ncbi:RNA polymerase sigma-70 factor [Nibrella saemangeumensis]|uniref:RNA polymerase sigma-70 factor n=1 Tax=Nibrella saemangeumensis TaxID=1084526 RepID=A0ABP8MW31_9BACT
MYTDLPEEILLKLLRADDAQAFRTIYVRYWRPLFNQAYRRTLNRTIAEELVQDIFLKLWENRQHTLIGNLEAYLFTALRYSVINHIKHKLGREQPTEVELLADEPMAVAADVPVREAELATALEAGIRHLPEKTGYIFRLSRFDQKTTAEIAELTGLTERAVEYHITQALRSLRLHLKEFLTFCLLLFLK